MNCTTCIRVKCLFLIINDETHITVDEAVLVVLAEHHAVAEPVLESLFRFSLLLEIGEKPAVRIGGGIEFITNQKVHISCRK